MARQFNPASGRFDRIPATTAAATHVHAATDITSGTLATDRYSAYADLGAESKIGTGATQVAAGDHTHAQLHDAVTIADSTSIDLTLAGQQVTAAAIFGAIAGTVAEGNHTHTYATLTGVTYVPASLTVQTGTLVAGTVTDIQAHDANYVHVDEVTGADPLRVDIGFTSVASFNAVVCYAYYSGSASHLNQLEIYNNTLSQWEVLDQVEDRTTYRWYTAHIYSSTPYINAGAVTVRFNHIPAGNASHDLWIGYVALQRSL